MGYQLKLLNGTDTNTNQSLQEKLGSISFNTRQEQKDGTASRLTQLCSLAKTIHTKSCSKPLVELTDSILPLLISFTTISNLGLESILQSAERYEKNEILTKAGMSNGNRGD